MPQFKRAEANANAKPDKRGKVAVRVILVDESAAQLQHKAGNLREDILVEEATVGEVAAAIKQALFG